MKIINKIKAFFRKNEEPVELDLVAAEIREGRAYLHTRGEDRVTYMVRANDIEIRLNKDANVEETNIMIFKRRNKATDKKIQEAIKKQEQQNKQTANTDSATADSRREVINLDRFKKRKFTISVYPEEYETIKSTMKEYGYKQADFVLACISTATKGSMEKAHKEIVKSHRELVLEQQALALKRAAEAEKKNIAG